MDLVIIGSGMAGVGVAEEYLRLRPRSSVTLLTSETGGYYSRPLLSHGFSREDIEKRIVLKEFGALAQQGIELIAGVSVTRVDRARRWVEFRDRSGGSRAEPYDVLVLATGSEAFVPPHWQAHDRHFRTLNGLADLVGLRARRRSVLDSGRKPRWAIVGGGLIGCEVASDLSKAGDEVVLYHAADRLMERQLTAEQSQRLAEHLSGALNVRVLLNQKISSFDGDGESSRVMESASGASPAYDSVLVATGFRPRTALAAECGLKVAQGIVTDEWLRTSDSSVYAVGDVAQVRGERLYAFVAPIRNQAQWLARHLADGASAAPWAAPDFKPVAKIHGFKA
jgi:NAD(P)H-nitrite reductase large subunit